MKQQTQRILNLFRDKSVTQEMIIFLEECVALNLCYPADKQEELKNEVVLNKLEDMKKKSQLPERLNLRRFFPERRRLSDWSDFVGDAYWTIRANKVSK